MNQKIIDNIIDNIIDKSIRKLPNGYRFINYENDQGRTYTLFHYRCKNEFNIKNFTLSNRVRNKLEICTICNIPRHQKVDKALPSTYRIISRETSKSNHILSFKIRHLPCNKVFKIKSTIFRIRLRKKYEICTHCNPLVKKYGSIPSRLPNNYEVLECYKDKYNLRHGVCNKNFTIFSSTLILRMRNSHEICIFCNPLIKNIPIKDQLPAEYELIKNIGIDNRLVYHSVCDQNFEIHRRTLTKRVKDSHEPCIFCNPTSKQYSIMEMELLNFVESIYGDEIQSEKNNKHKIGLYTLDIFIPKLKIGIEFNGDYHRANPMKFTSDSIINGKLAKNIWDKDKRKLNKFRKEDIRLFVVWEYDWINTPDKVKLDIEKLL